MSVTAAVHDQSFDRYTGRCRLPIAIMQQHGWSNGVPVIVFAGPKAFVCKAHAERYAPPAFDPTVAIRAASVASLRSSAIALSSFSVARAPSKLVPATTVSLEPVEIASNEINAILKHPTSQRVLQDACRRLIVQEGCVVYLPMPSYGPYMEKEIKSLKFRVQRTAPAGYVRIIRSTRVNLLLAHEAIAAAPTESPADSPIEPVQSVGGLAKELAQVEELIHFALDHKDIQTRFGIQLPKGVLLSGPPGVGKTLLVRTATRNLQESGKCKMLLRVINGAEIISHGVGEAEATLRKIFHEGRTFAAKAATNVFCLFLDELDALCPQRDTSARAHSRVVAQLLTLLDGMDNQSNTRVLVFGATNLPNAIDPALRRPGRFDREIALRPPDVEARRDIFLVHLNKVPLPPHILKNDVATLLATKCIGYVGADIASLCRQACVLAVQRHQQSLEQVPRILRFLRNQKYSAMYWGYCQWPSSTNAEYDDNAFVTPQDFAAAMELTPASSLRGAKTFSKDSSAAVTWADIGGLEDVKTSLQQAVEWPLKFPETFERLCLKPPRGILLYGPPGCSKSTIVRACAFASNATFLTLSAADVFSPYVGDAEAAIRQVFRDARAATPAIIFMDEIDAIVSKREFAQGGSGGSGMALRVLSTLLNEMDGVEVADGLLIVGATNRPDMIDAALLRPGRFDRVIYVPLPEAEDRHHILKIHTKHAHLAKDVNLSVIAQETPYFSGAELENVCREAALLALRENIHAESIEMRHFKKALSFVHPVSTPASIATYAAFQNPR